MDHKIDAQAFFDVAIEAVKQVQDEERQRLRLMIIDFKAWDPVQEVILDRCKRNAWGNAKRICNGTSFLKGDSHEQGSKDPCRVQG